ALAGILLASAPAGWTAVAEEAAPESELRELALTVGHIDLFDLRYDPAQQGLELRIKDDSELYDAGSTFRAPDTVSIVVDDQLARMDIPAGLPSDYAFLGAPGDVVYHLPFT